MINSGSQVFVLMGHDDDCDKVLGVYVTEQGAMAARKAFDNTPDKFSALRKFSVGYSIYAADMGVPATDIPHVCVWSDVY